MRAKKTKWIITGIILSLAFLGIGIFVLPPLLHRINEPEKSGTRLSVLFNEAHLAGGGDGTYWTLWKTSTNFPPNPTLAKSVAAVDAILEMGEPAAPYLGRWLLARPASVHKWYRELYPLLPSLLPYAIYRNLPSPPDPERTRRTADFLLKQLKAKAAPALPILIKHLKHGDSREQHEAIGIVREMGNAASNSVPALLEITKGPFSPLNIMAAEALFRINPALESVYNPLLHAGLKSDDALTRFIAADLYWQKTHDITRTVSALTSLLDHPQFGVGCYYKLGLIGPEARSAIPHLTPGLSASDDRIQLAAAEAIRRIDPTIETNRIAEILKGQKQRIIYPAKLANTGGVPR